ncbi:MAG: hypothetical protein HYU73_02800 [Betaproteobacteria bacterium]|nr:hypothetical protein [Betaproteobacteria bacterium]
MAVALISTESGSIAGVINVSAKADERIAGTWTSYSPTRFGARTVEFFGNGTCQIRAGAEGTSPCKWQALENGRAQIEATVSGSAEVFSASVAGDNMIIKEPGRETPYVRVNTKEAYARQQLVRGPSDFTLPWDFEPSQR